MSGAGIIEFKLDLSKTSDVAIGDIVYSEKIAVGGNTWRLWCYPRGSRAEDNGEYVSLYLELMSSESNNLKVVSFNLFLLGKEGSPSSPGLAFTATYQPKTSKVFGLSRYVERRSLETLSTVNGTVVTILCAITVLRDDDETEILVPDLGNHLALLLERGDGADVSLVVGGETFRAHRAVLAARSPVFRAQLFGSMAEATMSCITLHDIEPATFRVLLQFMYTDRLPAELKAAGPLSITAVDFRQSLLAAADRYDLGRLKLMCAQTLWRNLSVETVAATLGCSEMYSCPEMKKRCLDFLMTGENLKKAAVTDGYFELRRDFPSVIDEIRKLLENYTSLDECSRKRKRFDQCQQY